MRRMDNLRKLVNQCKTLKELYYLDVNFLKLHGDTIYPSEKLHCKPYRGEDGIKLIGCKQLA